MLHNTDNILRFEFEDGNTYAILVQNDELYMVSIISEANYNKMVNNLPPGYITVHKNDYNSFFYIGKALPQILINDKPCIYELLQSTWADLGELKVKFSINPVRQHTLDYH